MPPRKLRSPKRLSFEISPLDRDSPIGRPSNPPWKRMSEVSLIFELLLDRLEDFLKVRLRVSDRSQFNLAVFADDEVSGDELFGVFGVNRALGIRGEGKGQTLFFLKFFQL